MGAALAIGLGACCQNARWPAGACCGETAPISSPMPIMAGDHNGLGMEPAAISGIYAANKIMGATVD